MAVTTTQQQYSCTGESTQPAFGMMIQEVRTLASLSERKFLMSGTINAVIQSLATAIVNQAFYTLPDKESLRRDIKVIKARIFNLPNLAIKTDYTEICQQALKTIKNSETGSQRSLSLTDRLKLAHKLPLETCTLFLDAIDCEHLPPEELLDFTKNLFSTYKSEPNHLSRESVKKFLLGLLKKEEVQIPALCLLIDILQTGSVSEKEQIEQLLQIDNTNNEHFRLCKIAAKGMLIYTQTKKNEPAIEFFKKQLPGNPDNMIRILLLNLLVTQTPLPIRDINENLQELHSEDSFQQNLVDYYKYLIDGENNPYTDKGKKLIKFVKDLYFDTMYFPDKHFNPLFLSFVNLCNNIPDHMRFRF